MSAKATASTHRLDDDDIAALARYCEARLDLAGVPPADGYGYACLPLCIIEAVFSIGARYASTQNTVRRFCTFARSHWLCDTLPSLSISRFIAIYEACGVPSMAEQVYENRQRTSPRNGVLKAEAVLRFSETLRDFGVEYLDDVPAIRGESIFEAAIERIPGQRSGISLACFYMLTGSENHVKVDRMVSRFIRSALHKDPDIQAMSDALVGTSALLRASYPRLTPRALDSLIWEYRRQRKE